MKKSVQNIATALLLSISATVNAQDWTEIGNNSTTPEIAQAAGFDISADGKKIYVAYSNDASRGEGKLCVKVLENGNWSFVGNQGITIGRAHYTDIVSANDTLYIVGRDNNNKDKSSVYKLDNNTWKPIGESSEYSSDNQLAWDGKNLIWACSEKTLVIRRLKSDGQWEVLPGLPGASKSEMVAYDVATLNGQVYITYVKNDAEIKEVRPAQVVKLTADNKWQKIGPDVPAHHITALQLAFDGNNPMPYVALREDDTYKVKAARLIKKDNKEVWEVLGADGIGKNYDQGLALAINKGIPLVAYQESRNDQGKAYSFKNSQWVGAASSENFSPEGQSPMYVKALFAGDKIYLLYRTVDGSHATVKTIQ